MPDVGKNDKKDQMCRFLAAKPRHFWPGSLIFFLCLSYLTSSADQKIKNFMPSLVPSLAPVACGREGKVSTNHFQNKILPA